MDTVTPYTVLKYLHILLAIVAVGFNASYAIWIARARKQPEHLAHTLRGIKFLDDKFANPAYLLLLVSGLAMVHFGRLPLTTFWLAASLALWLIAIGLGYGVYTPTLRKQIAAIETQGPGSADAQQLAKRGTVVGVTLSVIVLVILALMVFKPSSL
jgi:uncharacterized membrane protein